MNPADLSARSFRAYSPQARSLAQSHLDLLRRLPPALLPLFLDRIMRFDEQFPPEQQSLQRELRYLSSLAPRDLNPLIAAFAAVRVDNLEAIDWVAHPAVFSRQLSAFLWSTAQMDRFRDAAEAWAAHLRAALPDPSPPLPRLCLVIVGQGATTNSASLFRKLRPHGVCFTSLDPQDGLAQILALLDARTAAHPLPYAHWYIDGGTPSPLRSPGVSCVSWSALAPARKLLAARMAAFVNSGTGGPESLLAAMAQLQPKDLGLAASGAATPLDGLRLKVFTEGSGTQIFSTTFVQWSAREVLRRAQPVTLVVRFAPRQRNRPMNELLADDSPAAVLDPQGSLIDADIGAYYTWLDLQRLSGASQSVFVAWFEDRGEALVIAPTMPAGTQSASAFNLNRLLRLVV
jgi:hypothetical protein